ncbi:MAG: two-component sensor histidine kinase [Sphingomonadales bacterium]|nr:two-component sensor histidine kinase [Sphingomonadales bacterium]
MLLSLAGALLLAQAISAVLLYRSQEARREEGLAHMVALRLVGGMHRPGEGPALGNRPALEIGLPPVPGQQRPDMVAQFTPIGVDRRLGDVEKSLRLIFAEQGIPLARLIVVKRPFAADPLAQARYEEREAPFARHSPPPSEVLVAALQLDPRGPWRVAHVSEPFDRGGLLAPLLVQTLVIYALLVGAMAMILRRITRPLAALTARLEYFTATRDPAGRLEPSGPADLVRLILAHNAMEARIIGLLDEKDVMLGAIGHDLKTPLAALRVRIESVEDEGERARMAAVIEDLARSLDDILSLARVGRPSDPVETTELSALVAAVVEEFEDMGEPVTLADMPRLVLPLRATWVRRALRNLIGNALRYGETARVSLAREVIGKRGSAVIIIEDEGPGIAGSEIARMVEPFTRGDPSRNSETGGAGLGLTLALAIAEQHGGTLRLANRETGHGLRAELRLPMA